MNKKITDLQSLAPILKGKYWIKGDKQRVYLDRGHNTKKMSTTTYVYESGNSEFKVCCYVECPSQTETWINSQQNKIIESVEEDLDILNLRMIDYKVSIENSITLLALIQYKKEDPIWYTEEFFTEKYNIDLNELFEVPLIRITND